MASPAPASNELSESQLSGLCRAVGWQGGTYWQVLEEVGRLKRLEQAAAKPHTVYRPCAAHAHLPVTLTTIAIAAVPVCPHCTPGVAAVDERCNVARRLAGLSVPEHCTKCRMSACKGADGVTVGGHQTFSQQTPTAPEDGKA